VNSFTLEFIVSTSLTVQHIIDRQASLLAELYRRQAIVREFTRQVARQYATGLYLFGPPGTAKTYTVRSVLGTEINDPYCYQRGHLTPGGLFDLICEHPEEVIVLDDLGFIFRSDVALQLLLSALEHPDPDDQTCSRILRYRKKDSEVKVTFTGGIVCISNRLLHGDELLEAFKSPVHVLNYNPTDAQLGALMLDIAKRGHQGIPPAEATKVAQHLLSEMLRLGCRFDLRLFVNKALTK
jgi:hypothetical protein